MNYEKIQFEREIIDVVYVVLTFKDVIFRSDFLSFMNLIIFYKILKKLRFKIWFNPPFLQKCLYQVRVITVFTVFRLLTDFFCLYTYEFWLSFCKIVRSSIICDYPYSQYFCCPSFIADRFFVRWIDNSFVEEVDDPAMHLSLYDVLCSLGIQYK
jgi:hypothetical protein